MTNFEKAIAVCDRALGEEWDNPINLATFQYIFTPEVVREMLAMLESMTETIEAQWGPGSVTGFYALMRKIGGGE